MILVFITINHHCLSSMLIGLNEYELVLNFSISFSIFYVSKQNRHDFQLPFFIFLRSTLIILMRLARKICYFHTHTYENSFSSAI